MGNPYETGLDRNPANYETLTPLLFIEWSAYVYPARPAVIHGARRFTWAETYARARRLASALTARGIGLGDTVALMAANTPEMYEAHFGVPMVGAVLNTLNTRLDADAIGFMLRHGGATVVITDREFSPTMSGALEKLEHRPLVIDIDDPEYDGPGERLGETDYETFISEGDPNYAWQRPADEWQAISLNYTSGTTADPKGVVYHHRGAYLNGIGNISLTPPVDTDLTLPFHDTSLDQYVRLLLPKLSPFTTATVTGAVRVLCELACPNHLLVDATVDAFEMTLLVYQLKNGTPIRIAFEWADRE